ncbi:hypothetical protein [Rhizobium leguminosarum]|uniref:hypothetical protein n=1 Tax=Rhizobium leguminosarum TaxID=384 RepID=UPI001AE8D57C|nr:hypothetical protein [Rhizobium leguminosarum]MBP2449255.1 hypothetical protein [Rhizobium leguminosarum]
MKSPWKFLVGIARRNHEHAKPDASPTSGDEAPISSEPTVTYPTDQKAPADEGLDIAGVSGSDYEASAHVDDLPTLSAIAVAAAETKEKSPVATFGQERAGKRRSQAVSSKRRRIEPETVQAAKPVDEARALDDEILQLRVQLATKLVMQNSQLRKMLARFEH